MGTADTSTNGYFINIARTFYKSVKCSSRPRSACRIHCNSSTRNWIRLAYAQLATDERLNALITKVDGTIRAT